MRLIRSIGIYFCSNINTITIYNCTTYTTNIWYSYNRSYFRF